MIADHPALPAVLRVLADPDDWPPCDEEQKAWAVAVAVRDEVMGAEMEDAMTAETRIVHFSVDPALQAYCDYLLRVEGRVFDPKEYDVFAAGYRARVAEEQAPRVRDVTASPAPAAVSTGAGQ